MFLFEHSDFKTFITQVSNKRSIPEAIVEKDYWVTYVLYHLNNSEFKYKYIFKGGTSLSKGWKLLDRFSEDIDLLFLVDSDVDSTKQKRKRLEKVRDFVAKLKGLEFDKDNPDNSGGNESRTACYKFPNESGKTLLSLAPTLKLEMGYRGGAEPSEKRKIQSYLGEELEQVGQSSLAKDILGFEVECLHPKRTFAEKLFALHDAYESQKIEAKVRHYYDVHQLLDLKEVQDFLGTGPYNDLKKDVAKFTIDNFSGSKVPENNDFKNSKAFSPEENMKKKITTAHEKSDLFFGKKPTMEEILSRIDKFKAKF